MFPTAESYLKVEQSDQFAQLTGNTTFRTQNCDTVVDPGFADEGQTIVSTWST
jgi:hypothetical protein